jgi:hypothetical protein
LDGLVHYPTIEVPDETWTVHALLYWDVIATIVPPLALEEPESMSPFNRDLMGSGLLRQLPVADYRGVRYPLVPSASGSFLEYQRRLSKELLEARRTSFEAGSTMGMFRDKGTFQLFQSLSDRGLAAPSHSSDIEWDVELGTATDYLAILACAYARELSGPPGNRWVVGTSGLHNVLPLLAPSGQAEEADLRMRGQSEVSNVQKLILGELLPVPDGPMSAEQLRAFRQEFGQFLPSFRRFVEAQIDVLRQYTRPEDQRRELDQLQRQCEEHAEQAEELLRMSGVRSLRRNSAVQLLKETPIVKHAVRFIDAAVPIFAGAPREIDSPLAYALFFRAQPHGGPKEVTIEFP